jgi:hypothetical protein
VKTLRDILGVQAHRRYARWRNKYGAQKAREMAGLPPCGAALPGEGRGFVPLLVPDTGMPQVRWIFEEINRQRVPATEILRRAGLHHNALADWRRMKHAPNLGNIEAVANALGYTLKPVKLRSSEGENADE